MRMLGDVRQGWCWVCHSPPGRDCPDRGKAVRTMKRVEQREFARSLLPEADAGWLRTLGPCFTDAGIDCEHGCNGDCVESGSDRCTFACHEERP